MDPMTLMLIAGLIQGGLGIYQGINSKRLGDRFKAQEKADFRDSLGPIEENKALAEKQMREGLPFATRELYKTQFASDNLRNLRAAREMSGGRLNSVLGRLFALNQNRAAQNLASMDAQARERAQMQLMGVNRDIAAIERAQIQRQMQQEDMTQQQIAGLSQDAMQNVTGAVKGVAQGAMYDQYIDSLSGTTTNTKKAPDYLKTLQYLNNLPK